jgi:hypothetical protein
VREILDRAILSMPRQVPRYETRLEMESWADQVAFALVAAYRLSPPPWVGVRIEVASNGLGQFLAESIIFEAALAGIWAWIDGHESRK